MTSGARRPVLWLVTPVHGRETLTRLCFEQRARMLDELAGRGVDAHQLVVGDDANVDAAREYGFATLRRPNVLGRRVNDGLEWACREGGADFVSYCGSDDWHLADYFVGASPDTIRTCRLQAFVSPRGTRLAVVRGTAAFGQAPWIIPRGLLEPCGFRPAADDAANGIDNSTARGVLAALMPPNGSRREHRALVARTFDFVDADALRMVDFKGGGEQITPWERVVGRRELELDSRTPFETLATRYDVDLCVRAERFYADRRAR